jgi:hypothetical protein
MGDTEQASRRVAISVVFEDPGDFWEHSPVTGADYDGTNYLTFDGS